MSEFNNDDHDFSKKESEQKITILKNVERKLEAKINTLIKTNLELKKNWKWTTSQ